MKALNITTLILLIIGGLNWGLVAIDPAYDLVAMIGGGPESIFAKLIYSIVALCAIYQLFMIGPITRAETHGHRSSRHTPARA